MPANTKTWTKLVANIVSKGPDKIHELAAAMLETHKDVAIRVNIVLTLELKVYTRTACNALPIDKSSMDDLPPLTNNKEYDVLVAVRTYNYVRLTLTEVTYTVLFHQHQTKKKQWGLFIRGPEYPKFEGDLLRDELPEVLRALLVRVFIPYAGANRIHVLRAAFTDSALC